MGCVVHLAAARMVPSDHWSSNVGTVPKGRTAPGIQGGVECIALFNQAIGLSVVPRGYVLPRHQQ
jgi:hypothetical protein